MFDDKYPLLPEEEKRLEAFHREDQRDLMVVLILGTIGAIAYLWIYQ